MALGFLLLSFLIGVFPPSALASAGLIKPSSKFYFLQTWQENIRLSLNFSKEKKLDYLLTLTEKRVEEMEGAPTPAVTRLYEKHYQSLDKLANQMENKEVVAERIRENSLRQQATLAKVYVQVSEPAKEAIIKAQENSSKHVAQTIERVGGVPKAEEYVQQVAVIQQLEKLGQLEQVERVLQEDSPNADPATATPRELKGTNSLLPGQGLNPTNQGQDGGQGMEPAGQVEMNAPAGQN